jgi:hypothetical protein
MEDHFAADIVNFDHSSDVVFFFVSDMSLLNSLTILLLFVKSSFYDRVMLYLMTSLISSLLFGAGSTLVVVSYLVPLATHIRIKRLHLSIVELTAS